jgi:glycosyltransferase involved in cell wall biosynthesis
MIKVSVIIPCYNAEDYISKCLEMLFKDKLSDKEIIMINDGSKDNTLKILKEYQKDHKEIKIINQKNSGQAVARNKGLALASGEYITFVDVDDWVEENMIYELYNYANSNNSDYVYCDYYEHYSQNNKKINNYHTDDEKKNAILANFAPWGKLISKELLNKLDFKFCEGRIFEDVAVIPYLAASAKKTGYLKKSLYYYNMANTNSTTRKKAYDKRFEDMLFVSDYLYENITKNNLLEEYYKEFEYIFLDSILKSGVLKFAKYKEGIGKIKQLRENVKSKFPKLLNNKYYKKESLYRRFTAFSSVYFPAYLLYLMKRVKK